MASIPSSDRFSCFITTAMSFNALSTRSPVFIAAQNKEIARSGSLLINCSWKIHNPHVKNITLKTHERRHKWGLYLGMFGSTIRGVTRRNFVDHMKRLLLLVRTCFFPLRHRHRRVNSFLHVPRRWWCPVTSTWSTTILATPHGQRFLFNFLEKIKNLNGNLLNLFRTREESIYKALDF